MVGLYSGHRRVCLLLAWVMCLIERGRQQVEFSEKVGVDKMPLFLIFIDRLIAGRRQGSLAGYKYKQSVY